MKLSDEVLDELTRWACFSADTVVSERQSNHDTPAQTIRHVVRRTIDALAANDLIRVPDIPEEIMYDPDPPYESPFGERRSIINKFHDEEATDIISRSEMNLCECDRPDQRDNPHRHILDIACVYWMAGRPSVEDRIDACRQLNIKDIETPSEVSR